MNFAEMPALVQIGTILFVYIEIILFSLGFVELFIDLFSLLSKGEQHALTTR